MKAFLINQWSLFKSHRIPTDTAATLSWVASILISAYIVIIMALPLYQTTRVRGELFTLDNDGGRAVEVAMDSPWYRSNHFAPYGNLYYRLAHSLAQILPAEPTESRSKIEREEFSHHFAMMFLSLLAVWGTGFLIGVWCWGMSFLTPLFGSAFLVVMSQSHLWTEWIFRAHPDQLLVLMITAATYLFARYLKSPEDRRIFLWSAFAWGVAMAVKRTTATYIPAILIVMLVPFNREKLHNALKYIGYMLFAYLLVGFPQNFGFYKHIKFLLYESSLHTLADSESIKSNLSELGKQLVFLIPLVLGTALLSENRARYLSKKFFIFLALSFVPVLARKMSFPGQQHTMPLAISVAVMALLMGFQFLPSQWNKYPRISALVLSLGLIISIGVSPTYVQMRDSQLSCGEDISAIVKLLEPRVAAEKRFLKDPYFPFSDKIDPYMSTAWEMSWENVDADVKYLGLNRRGGNDQKPFYKVGIFQQNSVTAPNGAVFQKIFDGQCGLSLWEKQ